ncbi:hypothetical protein MSAN_02055700 [Mycena sanguinolenta]|uniref:DUF6535 domain-containing protein n=1 Tax=Mycena sanguinolenta TaxID=230812 RepID=A0A8H6XJE7_9AGAR|nr:hypothetical protein MSAN_02055700 [Mycena sanguinolenta]
MDPGQALESGSAGVHSGKGSVLHRLASAISHALGRRTSTSKTPEPSISQPEKPDPEKGYYSNAENEEACAKIWSIYVGEAERYDTALVESWKADMEGMLIFSGLFSASLTAFLIESYKMLQPDSGDLTVAGITQLSRQLAAIASNTTFVVPPSQSFMPTAASLWCNALWFISLSLSLTCALLATLVEQWAREFLHKTEMRPSPLRRARVFSFLYFGLKQFRMHTIVDAIPFLLHASLLLFFAGLVAFLLPVNHIMMYLMCIVLFVFLVLYTVLTILPVVRLECPYRTPLSAPLWSMLQSPFALFDKSDSSGQQTMTEAVAALALQDTKHRDQRAIQWTLDSLTDDFELLPFVEAIPDIIHGPNGFRRTNDALFEGLLGTMEVPSPLVTRICGLISGTEGMSPEDPLRARRHAAGHRAIWALCLMPCAWDRLFDLDQMGLSIVPGGLAASTSLAVRYQAQRWVHSLLRTLRDLLVDPRGSAPSHEEVVPAIYRLIQLLIAHRETIVPPFFGPTSPSPCSLLLVELKAAYEGYRDSTPTAPNLDKIARIVTALHDAHDWAYNSLMFVALFIDRELSDLPTDESDSPFEPLRTCYSILSQVESDPPSRMVTDIHITFPPTIQGLQFSRFSPPLWDTLARIVFRMFPFFSSSACNIYRYLGQRGNPEAIQYALTDCDLTKLAHTLVVRLSDPIYEDRDSTILEISTVASSLDFDCVSVGFVDAVFAQGSPDLVSKYPQLGAVQYLRRLRDVNNELIKLSFSSLSQAALFPRVQEICHEELFHELSPLFLPDGVNIPIVIHSLRTHLLNKYISFLSDFFDIPIPTSAKLDLSAFNRFYPPAIYLWSAVDPEIQNHFFVALLAHINSFSAVQPNLWSNMAAIAKQLWGSDLFWMEFYWDGRTPSVEGMKPSCLLLLQESLELYHHVGTPLAGDHDVSLDTTDSKRLLAEVQKQISRGIQSDVASGKDDTPNEVEGSFARPTQSDDVVGDARSGNPLVDTE